MLRITAGGLDHPQVVAMLEFHANTNRSVTPVGSSHVFDIDRLRQPGIWFWSAWEQPDGSGTEPTCFGTGALKRLSNPTDGEIKSMHTLQSTRRTGVGSAMLLRVMSEAKLLGMSRLYLETGSFEFFAPARALYAKFGFVECEPFEGYSKDVNSTYMTRAI
jgi:putative acetyltransferase